MTLALTPDMLHGAYDYLRTTPPFKGWRLPDGDEIEFNILTTHDRRGHYRAYYKREGGHEIAISAGRVGHSVTLITTMAHEMIHLRQELKNSTTPHTEHNAEFKTLAERVCRFHGFDPKEF